MKNLICLKKQVIKPYAKKFKPLALKLSFVLLFLSFSNLIQSQIWNKILPSTPCNINNVHIQGICFIDDLTGYAGGYNGIIMKTINGGSSWICLTSNTTDNIASIYFIDKNTGFAVGDNNLAITTQDGGATWSQMTIPSNIIGHAFRSVKFYNSKVGHITGGISTLKGTVLRTIDGGITWLDISPPSFNGLYGSYFSTANNGIVVGWEGIIWEYNNTNWTISAQAPAGYHLWNIATDNLNNIYIVGGEYVTNTGIILKSTNGGSWLTNFNPSSFLLDISFIGNTGFAVGSTQPGSTNGVIYKSTNGGSWYPDYTSPALIPGLIRLSLPGSQTGYACGIDGTILKNSSIVQKPCCMELVQNGDFSDLLNPNFNTTLTQNGACTSGPNGTFLIASNFTSKCSTWPFSLDKSGTGNFLIVDGNPNGSNTLIWQSGVTNIIPNRDYTFSFYANSVFPSPIQSFNLDMVIFPSTGGSALQSSSVTISQASPGWEKYSMVWNSGNHTSVDLAIIQPTPGDYRDFGIDDISFDCMDCADFMTDVMNFGIIGNGISGNTYQYCLSPNISSNDIIQWDLDCDGTINATTPCATFNLTSLNSSLCVTVLHVNAPGDTCKVKLNTCLPAIVSNDSCSCDQTVFFDDVDAGFTFTQTGPSTGYFTPNSLLACDTVEWQWGDTSLNDHTLNNMSISHTFPSPLGSYTVCMFVSRTDANGKVCKREYCFKIKFIVATTTILMPDLTIKPNPGSNSITVSVPQNYSYNNYTINLATIDGKILIVTPIEGNEIKLNIESLPAGLYYILLKDNDGRTINVPSKVIKY